jgi:hypothetical protein
MLARATPETLWRGVACNARIPLALPANPLGLASKTPPKGHPYRMGCICMNVPGVLLLLRDDSGKSKRQRGTETVKRCAFSVRD